MRKHRRRTLQAMRAWRQAAMAGWAPMTWYSRRNPRVHAVLIGGTIGRIECARFVSS